MWGYVILGVCYTVETALFVLNWLEFVEKRGKEK